MKLLLVVDNYCYRYDGVYYLDEIGNTLIKRYLAVFENVRLVARTKIVNGEGELSSKNIIDDDRVEVYPIPFFQGPKQYASKYLSIKKKMQCVTDGCDCAVVRLPSTTSFVALKQIRKVHLPYIAELVFDCYDAYVSEKNPIYKYLWWRQHQMQRKACRSAFGVAPVTREAIQKHYTIDLPYLRKTHYSSVEMPEEFYHGKRSYPDKEFLTLVHVSNFITCNNRKGHTDVIHALQLLKERGCKVKVKFVGKDYHGDVAKLQAIAVGLNVADMVEFAGFVTKPVMRQILLDSDIAILPTKAEGLPRVIIEAMAMGLPCITTDISGNSELVSRDFLFEYGDVDQLVAKIQMLVGNKAKYEEESSNNFDKSLEYRSSILNERRTKFYTLLKDSIIQSKL